MLDLFWHFVLYLCFLCAISQSHNFQVGSLEEAMDKTYEAYGSLGCNNSSIQACAIYPLFLPLAS